MGEHTVNQQCPVDGCTAFARYAPGARAGAELRLAQHLAQRHVEWFDVPLERLTPEMIGTPAAYGHVIRYQWAAMHCQPGDEVNDVACGIGYGAARFTDVDYVGYDQPGVIRGGLYQVAGARGRTNWEELVDLNGPVIQLRDCDVTVCYETLEHVQDPELLADAIAVSTGRAVFVSIPTVPSAEWNPYHVHDLDPDTVPGMFPGFSVFGTLEQPEEQARVWYLTRD